MSFNIAHGRGLSLYQGFHTDKGIRKNLDRISRVIREQEPDIVALQEVDKSSHWNRHIDLLDYLQERTQYPFSEHGIHNKRQGRKPLAYGNAFLSKYPIKECEAIPFGDKQLGEKGFMDARIEVDGQIVDVLNLHLDFKSKKTRTNQIERVLKNVQQRSLREKPMLPPIICGDFNTGSKARSDAVRHFLMRSAEHYHYSYYPKRQRTFPSHFPSRGLDFVLVAKPFEIVDACAIKCFASDHLPVLVELNIPNELAARDYDLQAAAS